MRPNPLHSVPWPGLLELMEQDKHVVLGPDVLHVPIAETAINCF